MVKTLFIKRKLFMKSKMADVYEASKSFGIRYSNCSWVPLHDPKKLLECRLGLSNPAIVLQ